MLLRTVSPPVDSAIIVRHYQRQVPARRLTLGCALEAFTLSNTRGGLGDVTILTDLHRAGAEQSVPVTTYSSSPHFATLGHFNPYYRPGTTPFWVMADRLMHNFDVGAGHFIQRLRRAFGLRRDVKPRGCLSVPGAIRRAGHVILHFEPSQDMVQQQRVNVHPRAREIYPESRTAIQTFIDRHPEMTFAEVGYRYSGLAGVHDWTGLSLAETITRMAGCEFFLGISSGPMHLAAALDLKIVVVVNFPSARELYFPVLKDLGIVELEWLYPQSVVLHQEEEGPLVKKISSEVLEQAFAGELYPYWSDRYLGLLEEAT